MEKCIGIIGAGISGLLACKYAMAKGFKTMVFEEQECVGGLWNHTIESTKLQNEKEAFCFSDFPWPSSVTETNPHNTQVLEYIQSYAQHFSLLPCIKFNSRVISIDYVGESIETTNSWEQWGGTGKAFGSEGKWNIRVQHILEDSIKTYTVDFVVLCIGRFSGLPNIPEFPQGQEPQVFAGKMLHISDFMAMENASAAKLIKGKRVAVVGSGKSAVDLAAECASTNGTEHPCTLLVRTPHWMFPSPNLWFGVHFAHLCVTRFTELMVHKPGEGLLHSALAFLLSTPRWAMAKFGESYLRWKLPLKKYKMIPPHSILQALNSCSVLILPENFFNRVEEGSIVIKKSKSFGFCSEGLIIDGDLDHPLATDIVILATGYRGDQKLKNIFSSPTFQDHIFGSPSSTVPLYRQIIHPRIQQLAVIGFAESISNIYTFEMKCWWLSNFLDQTFGLPTIREMEKDVLRWEKYMKRYAGDHYRRSCLGAIQVWYNDQLCKDVKCNPRRKRGFFKELLEFYGISDYSDILHQKDRHSTVI